MDPKSLIQSFRDTLAIIASPAIQNDVAQSIASNRVYPEGFSAPEAPTRTNSPSVQIELLTTLQAAKKYKEKGKVAVLNFANPVEPGGGVVRGAMAQEECLCRSSALYPCLTAENVEQEYYLYHRGCGGFSYSDRLIYTESVLVFKDDQELPQMMDSSDWFHVDVITCAAPYSRFLPRSALPDLERIFRSRIRNILEAAVDHQVDVLVLGAFGCGAFGNPPELVSCAFRDVIAEGCYDQKIPFLVFAIKKPPVGVSRNAEVFMENLNLTIAGS